MNGHNLPQPSGGRDLRMMAALALPLPPVALLVRPCSGSKAVSLLVANLLLALTGLLLTAPPTAAELGKAPEDTVEAS